MSYRNDFKTVEREAYWTGWRIFLFIIIASILLGSFGFVFKMLSKPAEIVDKVTNTDRIIFNYEWFFETYHDCLAFDEQIKTADAQLTSFTDTLNDDRNSWAREDRTEWNRLNTIVLGLRQQRSSVIQEYNAKSKELTRKLFKDNSLPYQLEVRDDITVEKY